MLQISLPCSLLTGQLHNHRVGENDRGWAGEVGGLPGISITALCPEENWMSHWTPKLTKEETMSHQSILCALFWTQSTFEVLVSNPLPLPSVPSRMVAFRTMSPLFNSPNPILQPHCSFHYLPDMTCSFLLIYFCSCCSSFLKYTLFPSLPLPHPLRPVLSPMCFLQSLPTHRNILTKFL